LKLFDPIRFFFSRPEARVETREERGITIVTLSGRFDTESDLLIQNEFTRIDETAPEDLLVDLRDAALVGNHVVGTLMANLTRVRLTARCVKVVKPAQMTWWLELTRLPLMFEVYDEEGEALRSFARPPE
jgi:anti-anti-sigma regulatory factor